MGNSLATLASRPGRRAAATLAVLLLLSACQADAGAAEQPAEGLLVLTGGDAAELVVLAAKQDSDEPVAIGLPVPDDGATWISAGKDGTLVGSTADGGLVTSDPVDPRGAAADLAGAGVAAGRSRGRVRRIAGDARIVPDLGSGRPPVRSPRGRSAGGGDMHLLLVDPGEGKADIDRLEACAPAAPPAWLDGQRVALVTGSQDEPATIVRRHGQREDREGTGR